MTQVLQTTLQYPSKSCRDSRHTTWIDLIKRMLAVVLVLFWIVQALATYVEIVTVVAVPIVLET